MEGYGNENPGAFQSTRPLRGATERPAVSVGEIRISTHAPLAGRDGDTTDDNFIRVAISTLAPLAGRDSIAGRVSLI